VREALRLDVVKRSWWAVVLDVEAKCFLFFCGGRLDFRIAMEEEKAGIKSMRQNLIEVRDFLILRVSM
jgi:hypothetical protein